MVKLQAAKCPSCGADIEVDKHSDSTKCEYCNSKIIVDDNLKTLLIDIQNSCINGDHKTVENLCNINFGKYNATVDLLLMMYATQMDEIDNLPTDKTPSEMSVTLVDDMGIYDRLHS